MNNIPTNTSLTLFSLSAKHSYQIVLPVPFEKLICIRDTKRKGRRALVHLASDCSVHVLMAPTGIAIVDSPSYENIDGAMFMQCTNASHSSVGFLCAGRLLSRRCKRLHRVSEGIIHDFFLCIPQAYFFKNGVLHVLYHKWCHKVIHGKTFTELLDQYSASENNFVDSVFDSNYHVHKYSDIEFIYLNQFSGRSSTKWNTKKSTFIDDRGISFVEMAMKPDSWTNNFISKDTAKLNRVTFPKPCWIKGHSLCPKPNKKNMQAPIHS